MSDHATQANVTAGRRRDEQFERATLELAAAVVPTPAGGSPFAAAVVARLELGERTYGESWADRPLADLLGELLEEAADIAGWAVLALQALDELDADPRAVVEACVLDAARAGARAHSAITGAIGEITSSTPRDRT